MFALLASMLVLPASGIQDPAALARALDARLLSHPSATAVLQRWCADRHIAAPAVIRAEVDRALDKPATPEQRARLKVSDEEPLGYRRVRLMCGEVLLSEADNWYVPSRLTREMRAMLTGDTPFGTVIKPLAPTRTALSNRFAWPGQRADELLRHRALVLAGSGDPLAEVVETYKTGILAGH